MKFRAEHVFKGLSVADYETLYFDEAFNTELCQAVKLARTLVKRDVANGNLTRIVRISPDREIPAPAAKIIGSNKLEYTEYVDYKMGTFRGRWRTEPALLAEKIKSQGTFGFDKVGNDVKRWVEGEIDVKIFGVGGIVERIIVADVEKSYDRAAEFTQGYIAKKK